MTNLLKSSQDSVTSCLQFAVIKIWNPREIFFFQKSSGQNPCFGHQSSLSLWICNAHIKASATELLSTCICWVCCIVLQIAAACCSVLQCAVVRCSVLQREDNCWAPLLPHAMCYNVLQCVAVRSTFTTPSRRPSASTVAYAFINMLQCVTVCYSVL